MKSNWNQSTEHEHALRTSYARFRQLRRLHLIGFRRHYGHDYQTMAALKVKTHGQVDQHRYSLHLGNAVTCQLATVDGKAGGLWDAELGKRGVILIEK